jgi:hypothetical protein
MNPSTTHRAADRRRDTRHDARWRATVSARGHVFAATTLDVSMGGACIVFEGAPPAAARLPFKLRLEADGVAPLTLVGVTVWQMGAHAGVRFLLPSDPDRLSIAEALDLLVRRAA